MINICLVSGGKDSQATAIWCKKQWEDDVTYAFLNDFEQKLGEKIIRLSAKLGFVDLAKKKKRFPSTKAKFCTQELKVKPMIDFVLTLDDDVKIYQGIRWEESKNRSGMHKSDDYFKHYFEPYGYTKSGKPKQHTYRKKEIVDWLEKFECTAERPIISWSTQQVFEYIIDNGYMPNKLYQYGFSRVGCFPCIMCQKEEIAKIAEYRPEKVEYIKQLEVEMNSTFFPPDYIPARFCERQIKKTKNGKNVVVGIPTMAEVIQYVTNKGYGSGLFVGSHCQNQFLPCE